MSADDLPTVVLDTNAFLDVFSFHSLLDIGDEYQTVEELAADINSRRLVARRARAREALLMAIRLHREHAVSYSLEEAIVQIRKHVPPPGAEPKGNLTAMIANFVAPKILSKWRYCGPTPDGTPPPEGNEADDAYVEYARAHGLSLISHEGYREDGTIDEKKYLRRRAAAAGVTICTPKEYYEARRMRDAHADIRWFLRQFKARARYYIDSCPNRRAISAALTYTYGTYEFCLLGETERHGRVLVSIPAS